MQLTTTVQMMLQKYWEKQNSALSINWPGFSAETGTVHFIQEWIGEIAIAGFVPAVANAVFNVTGKRDQTLADHLG